MATKKIGRDASSGQFIPVKQAQQQKRTAIVETIKTHQKTAAKTHARKKG